MRTLCDHIFDLIQNSINAGADNIYIGINMDTETGILKIVIEDDGSGVPVDIVPKMKDPFYTTRDKSIRRVGLGLGLMDAACQRAGGSMQIESEERHGTKITAVMDYENIDCTPLGDVVDIFLSLLVVENQINWTLEHKVGDRGYRLTNEDVMSELGVTSLSDYSIYTSLQELLTSLEENLISKIEKGK